MWRIALELFTLKSEGHGIIITEEDFIRRMQSGQYNALHNADPFHREMVAFGPSEPLGDANYTRIYEGGVAVIDLAGPIYRHASDAPSGAVSTSKFARDLTLIRKDDKARSAILLLDTPGGEATGGDEVAQKIHEFAQEKHIETYIEGLGASLGYYWASPTKKITASKMAITGSIGVVIGVPLPKGKVTVEGQDGEADQEFLLHETSHGDQYVEFVSSQSPLKRVDPLSKTGINYYRNIVNKCADIFVADVARFRNIAKEDLPKQYGDGGVYPSEDAASMGLIDDIGTFESVHQRLASSFYQSTKETSQGTSVEKDAEAPVTTPESLDPGTNGGTEMGLLDRLRKHNNGSSGTTPGGTAASTPAKPEAGETQTPETFLAELQKRRPGLEQQFEARALLAATQLVVDSKIPPAGQAHVAYEFLTAIVDDALYAGSVLFVTQQENGDLIEAEGTRLQQIEAKYAALPRHSLAESRIASVREGKVGQPRILGETRPTQEGQSYREAGENGVETMTDEELMLTSPLGQQTVAARNNGHGTSATQK